MSVRDITAVKDLIMKTGKIQERKGFFNYFSNFFALPGTDVFFFATHCPKAHTHGRIIVVCRITLNILRYIDLPGDLKEIGIDYLTKEIFVIDQVRKNEEFYETIQTVSAMPKSANLPCYFENVWIGKEIDPRVSHHRIYKFDANWQISAPLKPKLCCNIFSSSLAVKDIRHLNSSNFIVYQMNSLAFANKLQVTRDYIAVHDDTIIGTKVIARNHHFHFKHGLKDIVNRSCKTFFHPQLPIFCVCSCDSKTFNFHLAPTASSEERKNFPRMNSKFQYKKTVTYSPVH